MMKYLKPATLFDRLIKMNSKIPGIELATGKANLLLGLDIRQNYVGLAVSDYLNLVSYPIMPCKNHMDSVKKYFPGVIARYNIFGFIVGKPTNVRWRHLKDDEVHVKKFISDLQNTGKFKGLKYTYWCDVFASKHIELEYKLNVEDYLKDLPSYKQELLVQKFAAVGTLKAYLNHYRDVEDEYENAKMNLNANK
ncbi:hypothetical protein LWI29_037927 [Acer saccharum]|uniref:Holliday junction resolvase n=1 Tax=Acer saccharum TaxID=4024 RepID=A0AA39UYS9_ACESA|nr:hypothetical protein LWI29_037927 [Acer saccharum]